MGLCALMGGSEIAFLIFWIVTFGALAGTSKLTFLIFWIVALGALVGGSELALSISWIVGSELTSWTASRVGNCGTSTLTQGSPLRLVKASNPLS